MKVRIKSYLPEYLLLVAIVRVLIHACAPNLISQSFILLVLYSSTVLYCTVHTKLYLRHLDNPHAWHASFDSTIAK